MPAADFSEKYLGVIIRLRELLAAGIAPTDIGKEVGLSQSTVSNIKAGRKWKNPKVPINYLQLKYATPYQVCPKCLHEARLFSKDNLCVECAMIQLSKLGFVQIIQPQQRKDVSSE